MIPWNNLTDVAQLTDVASLSNKTGECVVLFKHSTRCSVSRMALRQFEEEYVKSPHMHYFMIDLLANREVSNAIAQQYNITHESPQVIVLQSNKVKHHASHHRISHSIIISNN